MLIAKVIDMVVSTRKHEALQGIKLLMVRPIGLSQSPVILSGDVLGAGIGDYVMITEGRSACRALEKEAPVDAMVVGILDQPPSIEGV